MRLSCQFSAPIKRSSPDDYVRDVLVDVTAYDEYSVTEYVLGRMGFIQVLWNRTESDGGYTSVVCDEHSQELDDIYEVLMDEHGYVRYEFHADEVLHDLIVLDCIVVHPDVENHLQHFLAGAFSLFNDCSLVVTWREVVSSVPDKQLAQLGFAKAAETNLIYRNNVFRNDYDEDLFPFGWDDAMFEGTPEHEEWVLAEWGKKYA